jgi:hypothetical protein
VKLAEISESKQPKMCFNQINSCAAAMKPEREIDLELLPQLPSSELVKIVVLYSTSNRAVKARSSSPQSQPSKRQYNILKAPLN